MKIKPRDIHVGVQNSAVSFLYIYSAFNFLSPHRIRLTTIIYSFGAESRTAPTL